MTSTTSLIVGLFSILCLKQLQVVGVAENSDHRMTKPEQELLAKYLLQQLISKDPDPSLDPVVARLTHDEVRRLTRDHLSDSGAYSDLSQEQSQISATIVPAPPGLSSSKDKKPDNKDKYAQTKLKFSMPLTKLGAKSYYIGIFFKANWARAAQYCRYHGMHLASIDNAQQQKKLEDHIESIGLGHEHFWTSGTDQGEEGKFVWMSTGKPLGWENWNAGEPNNYEYEGGEREHCLELWNRDGKGLKWNDSPCSFETFFVCEV